MKMTSVCHYSKKAINTAILLIAIMVTSSQSGFGQCNLYYQVTAEFKEKGWTVEADKYVDLVQGQSCATFNQYFSQYKTYVVEAFSCDDNVNDVDVYLYTASGYLYMRDNSNKSYAILDVDPVSSQYLQVKATNYASYTPNTASEIRILIFSK